jgi:hypothetical protein
MGAAGGGAQTTAESIEEELVAFTMLLTELASPHVSPPSHREQLLFNFFVHLRQSSPAAQIRALDQLAALLERKPSVILGCNNLLTLIVSGTLPCSAALRILGTASSLVP